MFGILVNQYVFVTIFSFILIISLNEFYSIVDNQVSKKKIQVKIIDVYGGLCLFLSSYFYFANIIQYVLVFTLFILYIVVRFIYELYQKDTNPVQSLAYSVLGQFYIAVPFALINYLTFSSPTSSNIPLYHYSLILALFLFIWVNDSFAYLVGSILGKSKMFERISPKKSWEGFFGGAIFAVIASVIYSYFYTNLTLVEWIGFALVTVVFGTFGDLIESLFKRSLKIKDSGNIIPGHGGILDRLDSFIFALPALFIYIHLLYYL